MVHREILGKIKTVTVSRDQSGKYYASVLTENGIVQPVASYAGKIIGIDVGLKHLAVTSDSSKFDNPKHVYRAAKNLSRKQVSLSRKVKGSNTRNRARILVAKAHEKVANARHDWLHKLSRRLVNENQVIAVEDLNVKGMMQNHNLARAIGDAGWGAFTRMLEYKAAQAGKGFVRVNRWYPSSKTCSCCGHAVKSMPLNVRAWTCDQCGIKHDRDVNAAKNIALEAQRLITAGMVVTDNGGNVSRGRGRKPSVHAVAVEVVSSCL